MGTEKRCHGGRELQRKGGGPKKYNNQLDIFLEQNNQPNKYHTYKIKMNKLIINLLVAL